jgi:hypothetical protein
MFIHTQQIKLQTMEIRFEIVNPNLVFLYLWIIATKEGCTPVHVSLCPKNKKGKITFFESAREHKDHIVALIQKGDSGIATTGVVVSEKRKRH